MSYKTIRNRTEASFTEKKSEFIGYISPAGTEEEAIGFINEIRAMHRKATHNCYAYILRNNNTGRHSDDVLSKNGITDVVCVVTRYFGGILLGTGGLVHAYSKGASMALANAEIVNMEVADSLKISCDYTMYGIVNSVLPEFESIIRDTEFTDGVCIYADVKTELTESLTAKLTDRCNGKVRIEKLKSGYVEF